MVFLFNTTIFTIINEETTDVSTKTCLAILLRFYSSETKKVCDSILGLVELDNGSSTARIYEVLSFGGS